MNYDDPHQVEDVLDKRLDARRDHALHTSHAVQVIADALPALGIVAAVLGIIKTMGHIDEPPEVLGRLIGGALTGTFLGVFLAYGFVGPIAARMGAIGNDDDHFFQLIREVLVANLHAHPGEYLHRGGAPEHAPHQVNAPTSNGAGNRDARPEEGGGLTRCARLACYSDCCLH